MNYEFSIRYNYPDQLAATWFITRKRWLWKGAAIYLLIIFAIVCAIVLPGEVMDRGLTVTTLAAVLIMGLVIGVASLGAVGLCLFWSVPRTVRKHFEQLQIDGEEARFDIDDRHLRIADPTATLSITWQHLLRWSENDSFVLLYRTEQFVHYLPKNQIDISVLDALRNFLNKAGVPKS